MGAPAAEEFVRHLAGYVDAREPCIVATVVSVTGSASARPGAKAVLNAQGERTFGWVGGGCAETAVRDEGLAALASGRPRVVRLDLDDEVLGVGMPCGGFMDVYIEPVVPTPELLILGHGKIAETLARAGHDLEFRIRVNDPLATPESFPDAAERVTGDVDYAKATCGPGTYVVITTQHKSDYEALAAVLRQEPAYVGLVASPKRSALLFERLVEDGFPREALERVAAPCGLDLGAQTPQEIALAILAEIVQLRAGRETSGRRLVQVKGVRIEADGIQVPDGSDPDRCPR